MNLTIYRNFIFAYAKKFDILPYVELEFKFLENHMEEIPNFHKDKLIGGFLIYVIRKHYLPVDINYVVNELSKDTIVKKKTFMQGYFDLCKLENIHYDPIKHLKVFIEDIVKYTKKEVDVELCAKIYENMQNKSKLLIDTICIYIAVETSKSVLLVDLSDYYYIKTKYGLQYTNVYVKKKREEIDKLLEGLTNPKCSFCSWKAVYWDGHYGYCEKCKKEMENKETEL